jgi:hypothetical protein
MILVTTNHPCIRGDVTTDIRVITGIIHCVRPYFQKLYVYRRGYAYMNPRQIAFIKGHVIQDNFLFVQAFTGLLHARR